MNSLLRYTLLLLSDMYGSQQFKGNALDFLMICMQAGQQNDEEQLDDPVLSLVVTSRNFLKASSHP